jgi:hypothetical protein
MTIFNDVDSTTAVPLVLAAFFLLGSLMAFTYYEWDYKITKGIKTAAQEAFQKIKDEMNLS